MLNSGETMLNDFGVESSERIVPASSGQRRMYFIWMLEPTTSMYTTAITLAVEGDLALDRLQLALRVVQNRHEMLRTRFREHNGEIFQIAQAPGHHSQGIQISAIEAIGSSLNERREWAESAARSLTDTTFDITDSPPWRASAIKISATENWLIFTFHHILVDEISLEIFAKELHIAYTAPAALAESALPAQYSDYCLQAQPCADVQDIDYWRNRLTGVEPMWLPGDGAQLHAGAVQADSDRLSADRLTFSIDADLSGRLDAFWREHSTTRFMGMLAVFYALLQRWAGASDIVVGTQVVGRTNSAFFDTIGFFTNTVALRCQVTPSLTFKQLLYSVRDMVNDALEYGDVPFDVIVDLVAPQRDPDRNPLFDIAVSYSELDLRNAWRLDGLKVQPVPLEWKAAKFNLILDIRKQEPGLVLDIEYRRRSFSRQSMEHLAEAYRMLLTALCRTPDIPIGSIPLLDGVALEATLQLGTAERDTLGSPLTRQPPSVWELFEQTVSISPDSEALYDGEDRVSFAELAQQARVLAAKLSSHGVLPGSVIGICMPRRARLIVAMLAVWCAGSAFLLLDPDQPTSRQRMLIHQADVAWLIVDQDSSLTSFVEVPAYTFADLMKIDDETDEKSLLSSVVRVESAPAYVMFTSGSTGQPKGVIVDQASLVAHATSRLASLYTRFAGDAQLNVAGIASVNFDAFIGQVLIMMAFGHRLLLIRERERLDPLKLLARCSDRDTAIDVLDCTTSQLDALIECGLFSQPQPPKMVIFGGETASKRIWQRMRDEPGVAGFNVYGVTECTIDSTLADVREHEEPVAGGANGTTRVYIVDQQLQLLPPLFVGQICIGGPGIGQGYSREPAHTSERFVADPFARVPGGRMYLTGDRGRLRLDGQLEFWGRSDDQVKIRGQRIELREIEQVLLSSPVITRAAVVAVGADTRAAQLVAYVVPREHDKETITSVSVREFLRERLLPSLLPDRIEIVDTLPLTQNGKLDRTKLLSLSTGARQVPAGETTPHERKLCEIISEVLQVPDVHPDDDFFELGGNSLLAMWVIARVHEILGAALDLRAIFESRSIAGLAMHIKSSDV
jgi:amino acid adenylation domain-containing protein